MGFEEVYKNLAESIEILPKIDVEKLPFGDQAHFALCFTEFINASSKFDEEIRKLAVKAAVLGAIKEGDN